MPVKDLIQGAIQGIVGSAGDIISKFKADPTKIVEIQADLEKLKIDAENKALELDTKIAEIQAKENESARNREIQIATSDKAPLINKIITPILALIIVVSTLVIWALILFRNYEPKINEAMIIGSLTTMAAAVLSYYFGSSIGSKQKSDILDKMTK